MKFNLNSGILNINNNIFKKIFRILMQRETRLTAIKYLMFVIIECTDL